MDGNPTMSEIRETFRTPVRILLPKLLTSRNGWKAKSDRRKAELKAAKIKIRDCSASRDRWRQRTEQLEEEARPLRERAELAERELEKTRAALAQLENAQKKETDRLSRRRHAVASIPCRSFRCR
jgi:chromosome segregation ATPase